MPINEIQQGRFNAVLRKLFSMDVGAPSPTLATDIFPTVQLEGDRPEYEFLAGSRLCVGQGVGGAGGAGTYSRSSLVNPAGSGVLAVVTHYGVAVGSAGDVYFVQGTGLPYGTIQNTPAQRDARSNGYTSLNRTACRIYAGSNAATDGIATCQVYASGAIAIIEIPPIVLAPGYYWGLRCYADNVAINAQFWWRERIIAPSETR